MNKKESVVEKKVKSILKQVDNQKLKVNEAHEQIMGLIKDLECCGSYTNGESRDVVNKKNAMFCSVCNKELKKGYWKRVHNGMDSYIYVLFCVKRYQRI